MRPNLRTLLKDDRQQYQEKFTARDLLQDTGTRQYTMDSPYGKNYGRDISNKDYLPSDFSYESPHDPDELRAYTQGWGSKAASGLGRVAAKTAIEVAKMPGFLGGAVMAPFAEKGQGWETAVNNSWIKSLNNLNEHVNQELLPVYVKKAVSDGDLWANISSIDFWATDGADGIGYIASMLAPGAAFKALGLGSKMMGVTAKGLALANGESKLNGAVRALTKLGITTEKFDVVGTAMANTYFEASAEAGGAMDNFEKSRPEFVQTKTLERLQALDLQRRDGIISIEQYNTLSAEAGSFAEKEFDTQKATLGRDMFVSNIGILAIPNLIQSKMLWGKIAPGAGKLTRATNPSITSKIGNRLTNIGGAALSEGVIEEAGQSTVENMFTKSAKQGKLTDSYVNDFNIGELADNYLDTVSSTEGQKAMFLGAFLGGGMSAYHGAKSDKQQRKDTNEILDLIDQKGTAFNSIVERDTYKRDEAGDIVYDFNNKPQHDPVKVVEMAMSLQQSEQKNKILEEALEDGDVKTVEKIRNEAARQLIVPFISRGELGISALKQHLDTMSKAEENNTEDKVQDNKKFTEDIVEQARYMSKQFESYKDFSRELINLNHPTATVSQLENFYNKIGSAYLDIKGQEYFVRNQLKTAKQKKEGLMRELGSNHNVMTDEIVDELAQDDAFKFKFKEDPRINLVNKEIEDSVKELKDLDKIANSTIWNQGLLNEAFKMTVDKENAIAESEQNIELMDRALLEIDKATTEEELDVIDSSHPLLKQKSDARRALIKQGKVAEHDAAIVAARDAKTNAEIDEDFINKDLTENTQPGDIVNNKVVTGVANGVVTYDDGSTDIIPSVDKDDEVSSDLGDDIPNNTEDAVKDSIDFVKDSEDPSGLSVAPVDTLGGNEGRTKFDNLYPFFSEYNNEIRDKSKDEVTFKINEKYNPKLGTTFLTYLDALKSKITKGEEITNDEKEKLKTLFDDVPLDIYIKREISKGVLEPTSHKYAPLGTNTKNVAYTNSTQVLRHQIVNDMLNGVTPKGSVSGQLAGTLQIDTRPDGVPENNLSQISQFLQYGDQAFTKMEFFVVNAMGMLTPTKPNDKGKFDKPFSFSKGKLKPNAKGEVYLKVKQLNGKDFFLKINVKRLEISQAETMIELYKNLLDGSIDTSMEIVKLPDSSLKDNLKTQFKAELTFINKTASTTTVQNLLDFLIFTKEDQSEKSIVGIVNEEGTSVLAVYGERFSVESLDDLDTKNEIIELLTKGKRRNVRVFARKNVTDDLNFGNPAYMHYLVTNGILNTNAVVGTENDKPRPLFKSTKMIKGNEVDKTMVFFNKNTSSTTTIGRTNNPVKPVTTTVSPTQLHGSLDPNTTSNTERDTLNKSVEGFPKTYDTTLDESKDVNGNLNFWTIAVGGKNYLISPKSKRVFVDETKSTAVSHNMKVGALISDDVLLAKIEKEFQNSEDWHDEGFKDIILPYSVNNTEAINTEIVSIPEIVKLLKKINISSRTIGKSVGDKDSVMHVLWNLISHTNEDVRGGGRVMYGGIGVIDKAGVYSKTNVMVALSEVINDEFILDEISEKMEKYYKFENVEFVYDNNQRTIRNSQKNSVSLQTTKTTAVEGDFNISKLTEQKDRDRYTALESMINKVSIFNKFPASKQSQLIAERDAIRLKGTC